MLKYELTHPEILAALARAGHGAKVLIADGDYPASTTSGRNAIQVQLKLSAGTVTCSQVLRALVKAVPIESAVLMDYPKSGKYALSRDPAVWDEFQHLMREADVDVEFTRLERFKFYEAAAGDDVALSIVTGDLRPYANLLLTIGCVSG